MIAHELTHTIRQGATIQRSEDVTVSQQAPVQVQRLGLSDALGYCADQASLIPGFRMFTKYAKGGQIVSIRSWFKLDE